MGADTLSADAALSPTIRHRIAVRARYETANNGYLDGIVNTLASDVVGTGPRLQLSFNDGKDDGGRLDRREQRFAKWAKQARLTAKLKLARRSRVIDGEVFFLKFRDTKLSGPFKTNIRLYEAEQIASSTVDSAIQDTHKDGEPIEVDGIFYDADGNPTSYRFLKVHPGSNLAGIGESIIHRAENVIHYANIERPGQHRGVSEIASTLTVYNDLRRYRAAVVGAAEVAADLPFLLHTTTPPTDENGDSVQQHLDPGTIIEFSRNSGMSLPEGWQVTQLKPEQPTENYSEFVRTQIREAARSLSMPLNVALGDSSQYNYASGRLDHQTYFRRISEDRNEIETVILNVLLGDFEEADRLFYPEDYAEGEEVLVEWMWDGFAHVDPAKEASALLTRLESGTTSLALECAKEGRDWKAVTIQRAKEKEFARRLGVLPADESGAGDSARESEEDGAER
jgi:capsid protein